MSATGLFAVDYSTDAGPRRMLSMQLEPADGRRFLPMWDEPAAKATFALEVVIPKEHDAFSNMPEASRRIVGDAKHVRFQTTPKMSSYLLHLTVGELERTSRTVAGVDVGVVTRKGAGARTEYALNASAEVLPWFNEYFGTPYPLPKLDMIAVPGQSQFFGAMENWGAILYFEPYVLVDPARTSESQRQIVFETIAHEVAHQWFGNLVTMEWWSDLWLNEGFATWMASKVMDELHPQWQPWLQAVSGIREQALQLDAGSATHPVVMPVVSIDAVSQAFDEISYSKGGTVIRMIEETIGEAGFRDGMRRYMKKYAYGNANTDQLWAELQAATGKPVPAIAHDFTLQPGVPLVRVEEAACNDNMTTLQADAGPLRNGWHVGAKARLAHPDTGPVDRRQRQRQCHHAARAHRSRCNCPDARRSSSTPGRQVTFARCTGRRSWDRLRGAFPDIAEIDQLGLLSDAWALGNVGLVPATTYLDFVEAVAAESDALIWTQIADPPRRIDRIFDGSPEQATWRRLARAILAPQLQRIGWLPGAGQDDNVALLRESLIVALGDLHDDAVIAEARARFRRSAGDPSALPAAIRSAVMVVTAQHADTATWNEILERGAEGIRSSRKATLVCVARANRRIPSWRKRALELAISGEPPAGVGAHDDGLSLPTGTPNWRSTSPSRTRRHSRPWSRLRHVGASSLRSRARPATRCWRRNCRPTRATAVPLDARQDSEKAIAEIQRRARSRALSRPQLESWARRPAGSPWRPSRSTSGSRNKEPAVMKSP